MAIFTNEYVLGGAVIILCLGILIHKFWGLKRFFGLFRGSKNRVETARAKAAERSATEPVTASEDA